MVLTGRVQATIFAHAILLHKQTLLHTLGHRWDWTVESFFHHNHHLRPANLDWRHDSDLLPIENENNAQIPTEETRMAIWYCDRTSRRLPAIESQVGFLLLR